MSKKNAKMWIGAAGVILAPFLVACGPGESAKTDTPAAAPTATQTGMVPRFEVDPYWPKPLPGNAVMGWIMGISADAQDNIWVQQRADVVPVRYTTARRQTVEELSQDIRMAAPRTIKNRVALVAEWMDTAVRKDGRCCSPVPEVLIAFDQQGNVVKKMLPYFAGTKNGYEMLDFPHGVTVDYKGNVWVGNNTAEDSRFLKFDQNGKFLLQIGTKGVRGFSNDTKNLGASGGATVDPVANEVYISDGSFNRRVVVFDADTGEYKRHWGAYGNKPDDTPFRFDPNGPPPQQFGNVHCAEISKDRLVYVCDWHNNRIQVFRTDGTFVKEAFIDKFSPYSTAWGAQISRDPEQRFLYVIDGNARRIHILLRDTLEEVSGFGVPGTAAGQFIANLHQLGIDSKGNLYVSEADHDVARLQRFLYKGLMPAVKDQGSAWPQGK